MNLSIFILFVVFFSFAFYYSISLQENKYIRKHIFMFAMLLSIVNILLNYTTDMIFSEWFFYSIVFFFLLFYIFFNYISSNVPQKILAKQVTFWDVTLNNFDKKYGKLISSKEGTDINGKMERWRETEETIIPPFYIGNGTDKIFHPEYREKFLFHLKSNDLITKIENLEYFDNKNTPRLHKIIFNKLKIISSSRHINIDLSYLLYANDFYLEYFLIDFWKITTKHEALGVGTLDYYCETEKDYELIGALDNSKKSTIQERGSLLWAKFILHKKEV